jgi:hypothetical protein
VIRPQSANLRSFTKLGECTRRLIAHRYPTILHKPSSDVDCDERVETLIVLVPVVQVMAKVDKIIAAARTYSVVLLTLAVAVTAIGTTEFTRWLLLSQARAAVSQWIVADLIKDDFEEWWYRQQTEGHAITDTFTLSETLRSGREQTYSRFGAAFVRLMNCDTWSISVRQPSRLAPQAKNVPGVPEIPDIRASVPDLLFWTRNVDSSELQKKILAPLSKDDAAIENSRLGLAQVYKESHPDVAKRLPALLQNDMSVDNRWLHIGAEKDKAALQLQEVARAAKVAVANDSFAPSVYRDVERTLTTATVKVPVIDTEMPAQNALWVLSFLVFLNCLVLQVTLDRLQDENVKEREEPWLLIDAKSGLSRMLSTTWLAITFVTPIAAPCVVLVSVLMRARAGTISSMSAIAMGVTLLMLTAGGAWSSARILAMLHAITVPKSAPTAATSIAESVQTDALAREETPPSDDATV